MAQNILISSLDKIPNHTITETMGIVYIYVNGYNYFNQGVEYLKSGASSKGCNAIINFKWACVNYNPGYIYIYMVGEAVKIVKSKEEKELNEKGLKKESIEIVIEKGKCSREQAIKVLKECNGDITEALLAIDLNNK